MAEMRELDMTIKRALITKTEQIEASEDTFSRILVGITQTHRVKGVGEFKQNIIIAATLVAFLIFGLTFSGNARASAKELLDNVKTIFILDKESKVIEIPVNYPALYPALSSNTQLSDSQLSQKMGIKVAFPDALENGYKMERKAEAVGFNKTIDYQTLKNLENITQKAINDNEALHSLAQYKPYRSVGTVYKNSQGDEVGICVYDKNFVLPAQSKNFKELKAIKIGSTTAHWMSLNTPVWPNDDITQKPSGTTTASFLIWAKGNITYQVWPLKEHSLSSAETARMAESFILAQN